MHTSTWVNSNWNDYILTSKFYKEWSSFTQWNNKVHTDALMVHIMLKVLYRVWRSLLYKCCNVLVELLTRELLIWSIEWTRNSIWECGMKRPKELFQMSCIIIKTICTDFMSWSLMSKSSTTTINLFFVFVMYPYLVRFMLNGMNAWKKEGITLCSLLLDIEVLNTSLQLFLMWKLEQMVGISW